MSSQASADQREISLAYLPPTPRQTWSALAGAAVLLLGLAVFAPFAAKPLPHVNGFIPALDAIIFVTDLITASLLFAHFSIIGSRAVFALACGYLFSALIVVPHGLSFPGVVSPTGHFGGSGQTTIRIYLFWHLAIPAAAFAYVWLREKDRTKTGAHLPTALMVICSVVGLSALVICIVWLAAAGDALLPYALVGPDYSSALLPWLADLTILLCVAALSVLWMFRRSALDQWLMLVVLASIVELAITALFGGPLFSLGFYTGRIFSLVTSTVVLAALLAETTRLYARIASANMLSELAHANRVATMGQLTASIAHEVSQPVTAQLLNAQTAVRLLARQPPNLEEARLLLNRIISDGKRTADIVSRIRAFSKKAPAPKQDLEINEAILEILGLTRVQLSDSDVFAKMQLAEGLPHILGDRVQLQQVILNLIMNAIEAMSEVRGGSRELSISTSVAEQGKMLVAVSDTGPGLAPGSLERIFEAFYTTKANGLGMGLSICRSIVEAHGGRLWATPNEPFGAVFYLMLPSQTA